jgi:hypothetical protein
MWTTVADGALEQNAFVAAVMEQLGDALVAKSTSTTVPIATYEGEEITPVIFDLRQKGYTVTNDNTNLTISWGPQA